MNDNLKWLLLIPVLAIAIAAGFFIPQWVSGDGGEEQEASSLNPAVEVEVSNKQEQIDQFKTLVEANPQDTVALKGLGNAYLELGSIQKDGGDVNGAYRSFKGAVDNYRAYLVLLPEDQDVRIDLGFSYFNLLMFDVAEKELRAVTVAAPDNQRAWLVYGVILNRMIKTDEADAAWQKAYDIDPSSAIGQEAKRFIDQSGSGL